MTESRPILLKGGRILDAAQGLDRVGDVLVRDGHIAHAGDALEGVPEGAQGIDATGLVVCPGFIDLHTHLREPGQEEKETIATGTRAAARGGFTTVCCMPNTSPAIDNASVVEFVQRVARDEGMVRVLPIGAITRGRQGHELADLEELAQSGVVGFSDDGAPVADAGLMRSALLYLRPLGLPVINHCEDPSIAKGGMMHEGPVASRLGLRGMPATAEEVMVARDIRLAELTGGWVHLAHVSTAGSVALLRQAKERGLLVTAEVTPHHLTLTDRWVMRDQGAGDLTDPLTPAAYDTMAKVNPPLRSEEDVAAMVEALRGGIVDVIATDHAPHTVLDKQVPFDEAAFGISVLETALGSLLSLVHRGDLELAAVVERLTSAPARLLGERAKGLGTLRPGAIGDVVAFDPDASWVVDPAEFASKGKNTPLAGVELRGRVMATIYGGRVVYQREVQGVAGWSL